jgi:hypothetical protein
LRQIKDAGNTIEKGLTNRLADLAPNLQHFIDVIGKDAMKLIDGIFTPKNLDALESGIDNLSNYLGSKKFGEDIKSFTGAVSEIAADAMSFAHIIHKILHPFGGDDSSPNGLSLGVAAATGGLDAPAFGGGEATSANKRMADFAKTVDAGAAKGSKGVWKAITDYLTGKDNAAISDNVTSALSGATPDLLAAQALTESSGNPNAIGPMTKSGRAKGLLQFTDATAKSLGLKNAFDPVASVGAAVKYDNQLLKKYGGDVRKMLAAYNWGPGNLDRDIARNGAGWDQHLPAQTRAYMDKILSMLGRQQGQGITVRVDNNTSARVSVQANAAAAQ